MSLAWPTSWAAQCASRLSLSSSGRCITLVIQPCVVSRLHDVRRRSLTTPSRAYISARSQLRSSNPSQLIPRSKPELSLRIPGFRDFFRQASTTPRSSRRKLPLPSLPADYDPEVGVRFQKHDLDQKTITSIFGRNVSASLGNVILRVQHGRRLAGTLDTQQSFPDAARFHSVLPEKALKWLRATHPIDEEAAIKARIAREIDAEESEVLADAEKLGLWKPQQGVKDGESVYGKSGLEEIQEKRKAWEAQAEEVKRLQEESQAAQAAADVSRNGVKRRSILGSIKKNTVAIHAANKSAELSESNEKGWSEYYAEKAKITQTEAPPDMSFLSRTLPTSIFALVVVGISTLAGIYYVPPPPSARLFPDIPPAAATVGTLIAANVLVFVCWRIPPLWRPLNKYFLFTVGYPYAASALGQIFSHQLPSHLAINMLLLWSFGTRLHDEIGRGAFLSLFLSCGVLSTLSTHLRATATRNLHQASLGASGAIFGVMAAYLVLNWGRTFELWLPFREPGSGPTLSGRTLYFAMVALDLLPLLAVRLAPLRALTPSVTHVDRWAHIGGLVAGTAAARLYERSGLDYRGRRLARKRSGA